MNLIKFSVACFTVLVFLGVSIPGHAQPLKMDIFAQPDRSVASVQRLKLQDVPQSVGRSEISINPDIFDANPGDELALALPGYETQLVVFDRLMQHDSGNVTWVGHLQANSAYRVMLTGSGSVFLGRIATPEGTFAIRYEDGRTILLDYSEAGLLQLPLYEDVRIPPRPLQRQAALNKVQTPPMLAAGPTVIDLLILYSPGIASDFPGALLQTEIDRLTALANQAYLDSSITTTVNVIKVESTSYADTGGNSAALTALTNNTGDFSGVSISRDSVGADLVILLRKFAADSGGCGLAWGLQSTDVSSPSFFANGYAYGVVSMGSNGGFFCTDATYPHEIGHLMGSNHDRNLDSDGLAFTYAIGHYSVGKFGTIMSYEDLGVLYFSNPDLMLCGSPPEACGIAVGLTGEADNRTAFNVTNPVVAAFRVNADSDGDGVIDLDDAYPLISLGGRTDTDGDGIPNDCDQPCLDAGMSADTDDDGDGVLDVNDLYPLISLGGREDSDGDGAPNICDQACLDAGMAADTDTEDFVNRFYVEVLGRAADAGLAVWVDWLQTGAKTGADVGYGFVFSQEFINRALDDSDYLDVLYVAFFNRVADPGGKSAWLALLTGGTPRNDVLEGFTGSQEFTNLADSFGIKPRRTLVEQFVIRFYVQCLLRDPDVAGLDGWTASLNDASNTGADVANGFVFSPEFINRGLGDTDFVTILYRAFFGREPDPDGLDGWVSQLNTGATRQDVLDGFLGAQEFANLASVYGITAR